MLRLLLCLASVHLVAGAPVTITDNMRLSFSECPIQFYGKDYEEVFVRFGSNFDSYCFDKAANYEDGAVGDCIIAPHFSGTPSFEITTDLTAMSSFLPVINQYFNHFVDHPPTCALKFQMDPSSSFFFSIMKFGPLSALVMEMQSTSSSRITSYIGGSQLHSTTLNAYTTNSNTWRLVRCRKDTAVLNTERPTGTTFDGCLAEYCTDYGTLENRTSCSNPLSICEDNRCVVKRTCVVTGNTIIDHYGQSAPIQDFCGNDLLSESSIFQISAYYGDRRLSDVPFLDTVHLSTSGGNFTFGQGGRIFNGSGFLHSPTPTGVTVQDVVLTKVQGGVLAKHTFAQMDVSYEIFFDGTTLHILQTVSEGSSSYFPSGLCVNVNSKAPARGNPAGCDQVVSDPAGDGIDCDAVKQRCDVLLKEPFSNCSVDPGPYITACTNLLCNYTDGDGLFCHLLDAYARSCQLQNWRDTVGCSVSECYYKRCAYDNEFCGLSVGGEASCLCRSSYAAPFRANNKFGDDTVCASKTASVTLVGCLLEEKGVNISSLHLNDPSCTGVKNPATNEVTFSFSDSDNCAANVSINGSRLIYTNTITSPENTGGVITRDDQLSIEFSCAYHQPQVQTMSLKIKDSSVVKVIDAGEWTYVFNMTAFTNPAMTSAVASSTALRLDQPLWVKTEAAEADATQLALVIDSCWATEENNANAAQKYYLIKNGCSDEDSVEVISNGQSLASTFSFRVFQFVGSDGDVYLHCDTKLCIKSTGCTKSCGAPP